MKSPDTSVAIVLTVHNKEALITQVLQGILHYASNSAKQLILIFDGCSDRSEELAMKVLGEHRTAIKTQIIHLPDVFETRANNAGLRASECAYTLLIQDDMVLQEANFDERLRKPLLEFEDTFAVTGRDAHNNIIGLAKRRGIKEWLKPRRQTLKYTDIAGRGNGQGRDVFSIRDVVNRGPLMLKQERAEKLGYLDEAFAPYTYDDHDICYRAFRDYGWVCGSYVVDYRSDLEWGTTRQKNGGIFKQAITKNERMIMDRHRSAIEGLKHNETRLLV